MAKLDIEHLTKTYGDEDQIIAVDDLNITVGDGEFLVFVGPSGCGKSTTLRCIAGLEDITEGRILLDGEDISDAGPADRDIAMVFQNYALYPHMTARENMSFGLKMSTDLPSDQISARVEEAASTMGIHELLDQSPGELSGGQQQRVALGRAMVRDPEVFLMDEPLSNLDAKLRTQMRTELQNLHQELGVTMIYVTHDQTEAMTMGDRIVVLDGGILQQIGTPLECYHEPNNLFVAQFIGSPSMNIFDVTLEGDALVHDRFEYVVGDETKDAIAESGNQFVLGVRPEDVRFADVDEANAITVDVAVVEPLGDVTYVYFEFGGDQYTASVPGDTIVTEGEEVTISFPENRIHVFEPESGRSLKSRDLPSDHREVSKETAGR